MRTDAGAPLWIAGAALLALAAFGPIAGGSDAEGSRAAEGWFFAPAELPGLMVVAVAGWLAWRRRAALAALPPTRNPLALLLLLVAIGCAAWAVRADAPDWRVFSLAASALAFVTASRGVAGARLMAVPSLALLFAIPIPDPLDNEILWALQRSAAAGALWLHTLVGLGTTGEAVMLQRESSGFLVIEECSGLRGLLTLGLVSLVIRDLFAHAGPRVWWVVLLAPPVAWGINVVRVAWIAAGDASAEASGHLGQGVVTLLAGTVVLFFVGHFLSRGVPEPEQAPPVSGPWPWRAACAGLALIVAAAAVVPTRPPPPPLRLSLEGGFADRDGWVGERLAADLLFIGHVAVGGVLQRRYERRTGGSEVELVELFVGLERANRARESPWSSKLALPGRDWSLLEVSTEQDWRLFREVDVAIAARGEQRALVQTWRLGGAGVLRETLRSFFAAGPAFDRGGAGRKPRSFVRLVTPIRSAGSAGRDRARQVLGRFLVAFGGELEALEPGGA